jgi:Toxin PAAR-like domain
MSHTTYANGMSVCTKGTDDAAKNVPPDVCLTPDKKPISAPNYIKTSNLGSGQTTRSMIAGHPVWTENGKLDAAPSEPAHAGVDGGVASGTYRGKAWATSWSPDVLFEGGGVVRMLDTTMQNDGNTTGRVMPAEVAVSVARVQQAAANAAVEGGTTPTPPSDAINDPGVQAAMRQAWEESQAGDPANRHEEGGYITRNPDGSFGVERWPPGQGAAIAPPARDADGSYNGAEVLGEFHTHPNPAVDEQGRQWVQGGHQGDWDGIASEGYPGDSYIISDGNVWQVDSTGAPMSDDAGNQVPLGTSDDVLGGGG